MGNRPGPPGPGESFGSSKTGGGADRLFPNVFKGPDITLYLSPSESNSIELHSLLVAQPAAAPLPKTCNSLLECCARIAAAIVCFFDGEHQ